MLSMVMFRDGDGRDNLFPIITISVGSVDNAEAARIVRLMPGCKVERRSSWQLASYVRMRFMSG